jgi:hypothetical protein
MISTPLVDPCRRSVRPAGLIGDGGGAERVAVDRVEFADELPEICAGATTAIGTRCGLGW